MQYLLLLFKKKDDISFNVTKVQNYDVSKKFSYFVQ